MKQTLLIIGLLLLFGCADHTDYHGWIPVTNKSYDFISIQDTWAEDSVGWKRFASAGIVEVNSNGDFKSWYLVSDPEILDHGLYRINGEDFEFNCKYIYIKFIKEDIIIIATNLAGVKK